MKIKLFLTGLLIAATLPALAATNDLTTTLQRGLFEEEANQNLEAAVQAYQAVSTQFDKDRKLAATAIFRLGEVYRKQGKTNEATAQYERIVREFSDQQTLVTMSQQNLAGMNGGRIVAATPQPGAGSASKGLIEQYTQQAALLERLKKLDFDELQQVLPRVINDPGLQERIKALNAARQNMAVTAKNYSGDHPIYMRDKAVLELNLKQVQEMCAASLKALEIQVVSLKDALGAEMAGRETKTPNAVSTDEEEKEIQHIKLMVQNSPDLINAPESGRGGYTPLAAAASAGWLRVAKYLLDNGATINRPSNGSTPLHMAASQGHKAMVELLTDRGADLEAHDGTGATPLHLAAEGGFLSVAEVLVQHKADLNSKNSNANGEQTPLHRAVEKGHPAMVSYLISKGADVNARDSSGMSPLFRAARVGYVEVFTNLLAARATVDLEDNRGRTVLSYTAERGQTGFMTILLKAKADPNGGKLDLPLTAATRGKRSDAAEVLLRAGADPNRAAKCNGSVPPPGPNNSQGGVYGPYVPLQIAVSQNDPTMVKLLLNFKADANTKDPWSSPPNPLVSYVLGNADMLKAFLDAGADANVERWEGWPLITSTCADSQAEALELLLSHGAKPDVIDREGRTPLNRAAEKNCRKCVELLLATTVNVDASPDNGITALHWAVIAGNKEMAESLLAHGADANRKDKNGDTPLHFAVSRRDPVVTTTMIELLLSKGAEPNVRNNAKYTPLDVAKSQPNWSGGVSARLPGSPRAADSDTRSGILETLRKHGALDELPDLESIRITRGTMKPIYLFGKDAAGNNRYTLFEALIGYYTRTYNMNRNQISIDDRIRKIDASSAPDEGLAFPDFTKIRILRQTGTKLTERKEVIVNALNAANAFDCTKDIPLEFGDVIEVNEREYSLSESGSRLGLTKEQRESLYACTRRGVSFTARGEKVDIALPGNDANLSSAILNPQVQRILRSTSDLAHTKVNRVNGRIEKKVELVVDAQPKQANDRLLLLDGDSIDVPDKP